MSHLKLGGHISDAVAESRTLTLERFARVLARLELEYDLDRDVVAEAERLLRSLRSRELH